MKERIKDFYHICLGLTYILWMLMFVSNDRIVAMLTGAWMLEYGWIMDKKLIPFLYDEFWARAHIRGKNRFETVNNYHTLVARSEYYKQRYIANSNLKKEQLL